MKKTALITGASSGLGVEFARNFAKDGHNLVLTARRTDRMNALAEELRIKHGIRVDVLGKDLSDMNEVQSVFDTLQKDEIHIDFLVNNAGFGDFGEFHNAHWPKLEQIIDVNIKALTKLTYLFVNPMVNKGEGRIMNLASLAGFQPGPLLAVYFATKAYVLSFSEAITNELYGTGVIVTTLCPGPTESEFKTAANLGNSKLFKRSRIPSSKEVADYGYRKMMKGSMTVVPGLYNKFLATGYRIFPRKIVLKVVRSLQDRI
ncbi:MAG: SDR family oxidoreductase [Ignavibacteria bacterium]|nr:SDR family oxidoreductase [Ignavibacteria bacterium]